MTKYYAHHFCLAICFLVSLSATTTADDPLRLSVGPQLFIDDYLIASQTGLARTVRPPTKVPQPIVTAAEDHSYAPYLTVLHDAASNRYRMWYNVYIQPSGYTPYVGYLESEDAIHWIRPHQVLGTSWTGTGMGASVVDSGPDCPNPAARYHYVWWGDENGKGRGVQVAVSPDGINWSPIADGPEIATDHDIVALSYDPLRQRYIASCSTTEVPEFPDVRVPTQSVSADLIHWSTPTPTITPDERDSGVTQFYGMAGVVARGDLLVANLKVLRDDLKAEESPDGASGIGYTVLAWSRDGVSWTRDTEPFINRSMTPGDWDHAMAWGDAQLVVGDQTYVYYGGYQWGHKHNPYSERQIGLAVMPRDRYVSRDAGESVGTLLTPVFVSDANGITINALVEGELKVRVLDQNGRPLPGFGWDDFHAIHGDSVAHAAHWAEEFSTLKGTPIQLEFSFSNGQLYGFDLVSVPEPSSMVPIATGLLGLLSYARQKRK